MIVTPPPQPDFSRKRNVPWTAILWIAILLFCSGVVVAILLPGFASARYAAEISRCAGNIDQAAQGTLMYAADHDDRLPPADRWMDLASKYVDQGAFRCPKLSGEGSDAYGYSMVDSMSCKLLSDVTNPADGPLLFESISTHRNAHGPFRDWPDPPRHGTGNHVAFADGHVKRMRPADEAELAQTLRGKKP